MSYRQLTIDSPSRLRRFSHRTRFDVAVNLIAPQPRERILDYGAGDGYLLERIATAAPFAQVIGYEPNDSAREQILNGPASRQNVSVFSNLTELQPASFQKICCLEVMEHLLDEDLFQALKDIDNLLTSSGRLIVSVPVEIGGAAIVKYAVRRAFGNLEPGMTLSTTTRCFFGLKVGRYREPLWCGHKGFDYRALEGKFKRSGFAIESRSFSPLPLLKGVLNSQVFYVLRKSNSGQENHPS